MLISEVLRIHSSYKADLSNADILGDAFLMQANPVYKNIRSYSLKIGVKYAEAWPEYLLMPFHALGKIVETKTVPYIPSARLLREVESKRANALNADDISIPESYHLHEAAHVIAEQLFGSAKFSSPQEKILKAIVCESFANTVDAVACVAIADDEHRFFLQHNCYMYPDKKNVDLINRMMKVIGPRFTIMFTLVAYIHANFLKEKISQNVIKDLAARFAPNVEFTEKTNKDCDALMKIAVKLDPLFRIQTTQMYMRLEGYDGEIFDLLDFPFMKAFDANPLFRKVTEAMADIILEGKPHLSPPQSK